jgi:hypothetical protein
MVELSPWARLAVTGVATTAMAFAFAVTSAAPSTADSSGPSCVNGVVPLNPNIVNCNLPARGNRIAGAAPDAGAIIACRGSLACLSYYVNYPGTVVVPGYRP